MEKKYTINYSKVIPDFLDNIMTENEVSVMRNLGSKERRILLRKFEYDLSFSAAYVKQRADEIAYNSSRYHDLKSTQKAVIASNIAFDRERVIEVLRLEVSRLRSFNEELFTLPYLQQYIRLVTYFAINKKSFEKMSEAERAAYLYITRYTRILVNLFTAQFGTVEPHLIINVLNEIVSFDSELLNNKKSSRGSR